MLTLGGSIDTQLGKDPQRLWKDCLWQCWPWGGWSTLNLERICKDFGRIASDNVDPGDQSTLNLERIHKDFGSITSDNVDHGGLINTQPGKDPQRLWKHYLWQCWWWGWGQSTQLGKDLQRLWKHHLWQWWSWGVGLIDTSPRVNIVRGDPSKVFADPFQVECQLTPPKGQQCQKWSFQSLQILSKLSVNWPPQGQHCQKWSFQSLCGSFPSWVSIDPPKGQHCQRQSFQSLCRSFPSWVLINPQDQQSEVILLKSLQILSKLSVNWPPSPPLPPHLRNDNFQVECWMTPPPHLRNDNFQVECQSTPPLCWSGANQQLVSKFFTFQPKLDTTGKVLVDS